MRRPGRITAAQRRALDELLPRFGIAAGPARLDLTATFGRNAGRVLDVGFGDGEALLTSAANHPELDYLGVEVHEPGIGHLLLLLEKAGLTNVRLIARDAVEVVPELLPDGCLTAANLFFPDPWPKKRHHKRRLVQAPFIGELARALEPGGLLHIATDWADYVRHTHDVVGQCPLFAAAGEESLHDDPRAFRPPTKFERRGRRLGHEVSDLYYLKLRPE